MQQQGTRFKTRQYVFATAAQFEQRLMLQGLYEIRRNGPAQGRVSDDDLTDRLPEQREQAPPRRFYFGQFRHDAGLLFLGDMHRRIEHGKAEIRRKMIDQALVRTAQQQLR